MPSIMTSVAVLATALFAYSSHAQVVYTIDPSSVPLAIRDSWCVTQKSSCPLLCLQLPGESSTTSTNKCDAASLTYQCVCGNGLSPNASEYSQTLPFFICSEYGNQCVKNCYAGNTQCQSDCRNNNRCGAQDPTRVNVTSSSSIAATATGASATASGDVVHSGFGSSADASTTTGSSSSDNKKSGADMALGLGRSYGLAVVFTGVFAGFALVL